MDVDDEYIAPVSFKWWFSRILYLLDRGSGKTKNQAYFLVAIAVFLCCVGGKALESSMNLHDSVDPDIEHTIGAGAEHLTEWGDAVWWAWSMFLDPSAMPDAKGFSTRCVAAIQTSLGVIYFAVFLALIVDKVQEKMRHLKDGLTGVVEWQHTVILGYTEETPIVVREVAKANESNGGGIIAILTSDSKVATEKEFRRTVHEHELRGTRVEFRSGSRLRAGDLRMVAIEAARSIIVLNDSKLSPEHGDAEVLHTVLGMSTLRLKHATVVAQMRRAESDKLLSLISRGTVATVATRDIVGRLMLMFARKPGLSRVYNEILGFDGSEFYTAHWEECVGRPFIAMQAMFPDAVPIGVAHATGEVTLNPPGDYVLTESDELLVLAEDDDSYEPMSPDPHARSLQQLLASGMFLDVPATRPTQEKVLFAGWRHDVPRLVDLLDRLVGPGSEIHIVSTCPLETRRRITQEAGIAEPTNLEVFHHESNIGSRHFLETLQLPTYTSVIVTADGADGKEVVYSDASCLAAMLLIRGVQMDELNKQRAAQTGAAFSSSGDIKPPVPPGRQSSVRFGITPAVAQVSDLLPMVCEILDPRTQRTVSQSQSMLSVCDFIQSTELMSKILAMVSEDVHVKRVLDQLLGGTGTQFELLPAEQALVRGAQVSFMELSSYCMSVRRSILCGYMDHGEVGPTLVGGYQRRAFSDVVVNPTNKEEPCVWDKRILILITTDVHVREQHLRRQRASAVNSYANSMDVHALF